MTAEDEIAALKAATREAHEAIQDLRAVIKEAKEVRGTLAKEMTEVMDEGIATVVRVGLEEYQSHILSAIKEAEAAVFRRFDNLADTLLGERGTGPSLRELIERRERGRHE